MFGFIFVAIIVLVVLFNLGVFRKADVCKHCGKPLKGTEQKMFYGNTPFCLCKECTDKIHPEIKSYAQEYWEYQDYTNYLTWEETTKNERAQFKPEVSYGYGYVLKVDTERGLFSVGKGKPTDIVFRFADLTDYELNFKPEEVKEGIFGDKIKGNEFIMVELSAPNVLLENVLNYGAKVKLRKKGFITTKYEFEFCEEFLQVLRAFTLGIYIEAARRDGEYEQSSMNIGEVEKALALFMFDSIEDVTKESLKKQRNALIKAFHPDNAEQNEAYSQKINHAYEILNGIIKK